MCLSSSYKLWKDWKDKRNFQCLVFFLFFHSSLQHCECFNLFVRLEDFICCLSCLAIRLTMKPDFESCNKRINFVCNISRESEVYYFAVDMLSVSTLVSLNFKLNFYIVHLQTLSISFSVSNCVAFPQNSSKQSDLSWTWLLSVFI